MEGREIGMNNLTPTLGTPQFSLNSFYKFFYKLLSTINEEKMHN